MPAKLSDSLFIERTRRQNRERAERQRQRLLNSGKTALTVWIPANLRTALNELAAERGATIADTAAELLSAALECEPATSERTDTMKFEPDTVDWIAGLAPANELAAAEPESATQTSVPVESSRDALMAEIGAMLNEGLSGGEIARRLNAAGKRTATGKEFQGGNIKRDYRKWEQAQ